MGRPKRTERSRAHQRQSPPGHDEQGKALRRTRGESAVMPVVAERLKVGRESVETGRVRVTKLVREDKTAVDEPVFTEEVVVERVPVGRFVESAPAPRQEGDTTIYPVLEEVLVVERRLRLKEEVRISKRVTQTRDRQTVTLRSEDVKIDRIPPQTGRAGT